MSSFRARPTSLPSLSFFKCHLSGPRGPALCFPAVIRQPPCVVAPGPCLDYCCGAAYVPMGPPALASPGFVPRVLPRAPWLWAPCPVMNPLPFSSASLSSPHQLPDSLEKRDPFLLASLLWLHFETAFLMGTQDVPPWPVPFGTQATGDLCVSCVCQATCLQHHGLGPVFVL